MGALDTVEALRTNRPELSRTAAALLAIKGSVPQLQLNDALLPVLESEFMTRLPYSRLGIPLYRMINSPAVAAENGFALARPAPTSGLLSGNTVLEIRKVVVRSSAASAFTMTLMSDAQRTALGVTSTLQFLRARQIDAADVVQNSAHFVEVGSNIGALGSQIYSDSIVSSQTWDLSDAPIVLIGQAASNLGVYAATCLAVICATLNTNFDVTFVGREWPLVDA